MIKAEWTNNDALSTGQTTYSNAHNTLNALDCVSRQYAIEHYQHVCRRTACKECPLHIQVTDTLTDCELELFLHNLPSARPTIEQEWIPCKKPPTKNDAYLVTVHPDYVVPGGGQVDILVWVDDDWFYMVYDTEIARYRTARFPDPVIAWRPLPAPYKEES